MTYMHRETFEIYHRAVLDSAVNDSDFYRHHFHIDEHIALPVQVLNRKGYNTEGCCAGHPFVPYNIHVMLQPGYKIPESCFRSYISFDKGTYLPSLPPGFTKASKENSQFFTLHADGSLVSLSLEEGRQRFETMAVSAPRKEREKILAALDVSSPDIDLVIEKFYTNIDNEFSLMQEILNTMEQLYQWALALPDVKG